MSYQDFINGNIAPYSATKIGVYNSSGEKVGIVPLTNLKPSFGSRLYRFGLLSDVHNQTSQTAEPTADFQRALAYFNEKQSVWATCICGDITENGTVEELQLYQTNVNAKSPSTPVYTTVGNHDATTSGLNTTNWKTYTGQDRCFEITKGSDHFLFFGMNKYSLGTSGTPYLDTDIDWLEGKLEQYRNERCFVFTHLFFPTRAGNLNNIYPSGNWLGGTQLTRLEGLNDRYKNSIWFTGHSHWKWYLQKYQDRANIYKDNCGWNVHVPSCASPIDSNGTTRVSMPLESEGAIVDVYDDYIDIRGMDLKNQKYLPIAQYRLDTTLVDIPAKVVNYTVTNNLANATNSNSATTVTHGSSYTATINPNVDYIINTITVTMSGIDITSTAVNGNNITITNVTGNVVITVSTTEIIKNYIDITWEQGSINSQTGEARDDTLAGRTTPIVYDSSKEYYIEYTYIYDDRKFGAHAVWFYDSDGNFISKSAYIPNGIDESHNNSFVYKFTPVVNTHTFRMRLYQSGAPAPIDLVKLKECCKIYTI